MRVAKLRDRETSRRWQAHFDLIRGRLLAMKIRCYEYNWACAKMKKDAPKFQKPESNAWRLVPDEEIHYSDKAAAAAAEAKVAAQTGRRRAPRHPLGPARAARAQGPVRLQVGRDPRPAQRCATRRRPRPRRRRRCPSPPREARGTSQALSLLTILRTKRHGTARPNLLPRRPTNSTSRRTARPRCPPSRPPACADARVDIPPAARGR